MPFSPRTERHFHSPQRRGGGEDCVLTERVKTGGHHRKPNIKERVYFFSLHSSFPDVFLRTSLSRTEPEMPHGAAVLPGKLPAYGGSCKPHSLSMHRCTFSSHSKLQTRFPERARLSSYLDHLVKPFCLTVSPYLTLSFSPLINIDGQPDSSGGQNP